MNTNKHFELTKTISKELNNSSSYEIISFFSKAFFAIQSATAEVNNRDIKEFLEESIAIFNGQLKEYISDSFDRGKNDLH